jgi:hypothetical protein
MGVDVTKLSIRVKGKQTRLSTSLKSKGPTRRRKRRPKRQPWGSKRQSIAADSRESRGIVLVIVGQF